MTKKKLAKREPYFPSSADPPGSSAFFADMVARSKNFQNDEPWVDFEFEALLRAWPEPLDQVADSVQCPPAALARFLQGDHAALQPHQILALRKLLCVHRERFGGDYSLAEGPYVLMPRSIEDAEAAFSGATGGGDVEVCCEFLPKTKRRLKRLIEIEAPHIVGFCAFVGDLSFMLIPRQGARLPDAWKEALLNFHEEPVELDDEDFTAFLNTALFASASPRGRVWMLHLHTELYGDFLEKLRMQQGRY